MTKKIDSITVNNNELQKWNIKMIGLSSSRDVINIAKFDNFLHDMFILHEITSFESTR